MIYRTESSNNLLIQHYESTLTLINTSTPSLKKKNLTATTASSLINSDSSIHPFQQGVLVQNKNSIEEILFSNGRHRLIEPLELKADENRSILLSFYGKQQQQLFLNVVMSNGELLRINTFTNNNCEKIMERRSFKSSKGNQSTNKKGYFIEDYNEDGEEEEEDIRKVYLKKSSTDKEEDSYLYFLLDNDLIVKKSAESYVTIEEYNIPPPPEIEDNFIVNDFSVHSYSDSTTATSTNDDDDELSLDIIIIQSSCSSSTTAATTNLSLYLPIDDGELLLLTRIIIPFIDEGISYQLHNSLLFLLLPTINNNSSRLMVYDLHLDSITQFYTSNESLAFTKPELVSCVEFNCPVESFVVYNDLLKGLVMYYENALNKKVEEYSLDYLLLYKVFIPTKDSSISKQQQQQEEEEEEMEENLLRLSPLQQHFSAFVKKFQTSSDGVEIEFKRLLLQLKIKQESSAGIEESYPHFLSKQEGVYNDHLMETRKIIKQIMSEYLTALQTRKELIQQQLQLSSELLLGLPDSYDPVGAEVLQKRLEKLLANSERLDKRSTLLLSICMDLMYPLLSDSEQKFKAEIVSFKKRVDRIRNDLVKYRNIIVKYGFSTKEQVEHPEVNSVHNIPVMMSGLEKNQQFLKKVCDKVKEIEQKMELIE
ncbi:hypothetical protein MP638_002144 [Amoeboaphelidium occidentale]|nr:hypothetical protein MP638_002144 [Amoeboaphelidium occidentale]